MKWILLVFVFASLMLAGCAKSREAQLVGNWTGSGGLTLDLKEDKTFSLTAATQTITGKWSLAEPSVKLVNETISGKPVSEARKMAEDAMKKNPALKSMIEPQLKFLEGIDFTVSEDNKTLSATIATQTVTLTKAEAK